jgi:hypothetical protein
MTQGSWSSSLELSPGGGIKGGTVHGRTDEFGYYVVDNKVTIPDLHAT